MLDWLLEALADGVRRTMNAFFDILIKLFTETLSYDVSTFYNTFHMDGANKSVFQTVYGNIIIPLSVSILLLILVWNLYKGFFSKDWFDIEEPGPLLVRSTIGLFVIWNCQTIMNLPVKMMQDFMNKMNDVNLSDFSFSAWDKSNITGLDASNIGIIANIIIEIIAVVLLGWTFVKLMFIYVQRYVAYCVYLFLAPLGFSAMGSKGTSEITKRFVKLYAEVLLSLLLTTIWVKLYCSGMVICVSNSVKASSSMAVLMVLMVKAFGELGIKMDDLLTKAGLLAVEGRPGFGGIMAARMIGDMAKKGASKFHSPHTPCGANTKAVNGAIDNFVPSEGHKAYKDRDTDTIDNGLGEGGRAESGSGAGKPSEEEINNATNRLNHPDINDNAEQNTSSLSKLLPNGGKQVKDGNGNSIGENSNGLKMMCADASGKVSPQNMFKNPKSGQWESLGTDKSGKSCKSPVNLKDIKNGSVAMGNNAVRMGMADNDMKPLKDNLNSAAMQNGSKPVKGITDNKDGSSNLFEMTPNDAGDFNVRSGDNTYGSLAEARDAVGAESISMGPSADIDSSSMDSINSGMKQAAGITEEGGIGIPGAGAFKVVSMGGGRADGVYFDTNTGKMETFYAQSLDTKVGEKEVKSGNANVVKMNNDQYMRFAKDSKNQATKKYAQNAKFDRNTGTISGSDVSGLNRNGRAV